MMAVITTHAACVCVSLFFSSFFFRGDGQSAAAVAPFWGTCRVLVPAANPAGGLLQLIWSSVTCWDMKPTLQSRSNLHTDNRMCTQTHIHGVDRYINTLTHMHTAHLKRRNCLTLLHIHTLKKGSAMTMPPLSLLIGESWLKDWGISLLLTSCHFPMLRR